MGVRKIIQREKELLQIIFERLSIMKGVEILEGEATERLGIVSFLVRGTHHHLFVQMLNDRFGIQTRGGCSCAGTYGHHLLNIDKNTSAKILDALRQGDFLSKPGWIRLSVHPTMTNSEIHFILNAIETTVINFSCWSQDYTYNTHTDEYCFKGWEASQYLMTKNFFKIN
jgi:selenocysteine lyase/cysteine desulfurase